MIYRCGSNHQVTTPVPLTLDRCPVAFCTTPYEWAAEGDGSRTENARLHGLRIERENHAHAERFG